METLYQLLPLLGALLLYLRPILLKAVDQFFYLRRERMLANYQDVEHVQATQH